MKYFQASRIPRCCDWPRRHSRAPTGVNRRKQGDTMKKGGQKLEVTQGNCDMNRNSSFQPQIEGEGEIAIHRLLRRDEFALLMALREETRQPPALGFIRVDRKGDIIPPAGMRDVISAAAERALVPEVIKVEHQRGVRADGRVEAFRRLPGAVPDTGDIFAVGSRGMQRHAAPIASDGKTAVNQPAGPDLEAFHRTV